MTAKSLWIATNNNLAMPYWEESSKFIRSSRRVANWDRMKATSFNKLRRFWIFTIQSRINQIPFQVSVASPSQKLKRTKNKQFWRGIWIKSNARRKSIVSDSKLRKPGWIKWVNNRKREKLLVLLTAILIMRWTHKQKWAKSSTILMINRLGCFNKTKKSRWRNLAWTIMMPSGKAQLLPWIWLTLWTYLQEAHHRVPKKPMAQPLLPTMLWRVTLWHPSALKISSQFKKVSLTAESSHRWASFCSNYICRRILRVSTWSFFLQSTSMVRPSRLCTTCWTKLSTATMTLKLWKKRLFWFKMSKIMFSVHSPTNNGSTRNISMEPANALSSHSKWDTSRNPS